MLTGSRHRYRRCRWSSLVELYEACPAAAGERLDIVEERGRSVSLAYFTGPGGCSCRFRSAPGRRAYLTLDRNRIDDGSAGLSPGLQARDDWLAVLGRIDDFPG